MATYGVYDYDFFTYENVIPNLEAAKLVTYYHQRNQLATLSPTLKPAPYTNFYIRKEYDDGIFPREFFLPSCIYGGRAFTKDKIYVPLKPEIENTVPNMHLYDPFIHHFGTTEPELKQIRRILNCAHIRLSPDSKNLLSFEQLAPNFRDRVTGIFLHDYDLASLKPQELILKLSNQRTYKKNPDVIFPYPVGNKYPIEVSSSEELDQWSKIITMPNAFFLQFNGLMDDKVLYNLCMDNKRMAKQIWYNVTGGCSSENDFLVNRLRKIFIQVLFLRRAHIKILLNYDDQIIVTRELQNLLDLFNILLRFTYQENFAPHSQNLYKFCADISSAKHKIKEKRELIWALRVVTVSTEEMRDSFQYIREKDYDLFKMFYEWDEVKFDGRNLVNEWN